MGFLAGKSDSEPGAKTLWIGMQRTMDAASTIRALREDDARHLYKGMTWSGASYLSSFTVQSAAPVANNTHRMQGGGQRTVARGETIRATAGQSLQGS